MLSWSYYNIRSTITCNKTIIIPRTENGELEQKKKCLVIPLQNNSKTRAMVSAARNNIFELHQEMTQILRVTQRSTGQLYLSVTTCCIMRSVVMQAPQISTL